MIDGNVYDLSMFKREIIYIHIKRSWFVVVRSYYNTYAAHNENIWMDISGTALLKAAIFRSKEFAQKHKLGLILKMQGIKVQLCSSYAIKYTS